MIDTHCCIMDFDVDHDVDQLDFGALQTVFTLP